MPTMWYRIITLCARNVDLTSPQISKPGDIAAIRIPRAIPFTDASGQKVITADKFLAHSRLGSGFQFLKLPHGAASHEGQGQSTADFIDPDRTLTQACLEYIYQHVLLPLFHWPYFTHWFTWTCILGVVYCETNMAVDRLCNVTTTDICSFMSLFHMLPTVSIEHSPHPVFYMPLIDSISYHS